MKEKVNFESGNNILIGILEAPDLGVNGVYCILAHCFTCGENTAVALRISPSLVDKNFSSNVNDLFAASDFLSEYYSSPLVLLDHSLGEAEVLTIAESIPSVKAVVTVASPLTPAHVIQNFTNNLNEIRDKGKSVVKLGYRSFKIKKQFLDDVEQRCNKNFVLTDKSLLVMLIIESQ